MWDEVSTSIALPDFAFSVMDGYITQLVILRPAHFAGRRTYAIRARHIECAAKNATHGPCWLFRRTLQNELRPNHANVRVKQTAIASRPAVACPVVYFAYSRVSATPPMAAMA